MVYTMDKDYYKILGVSQNAPTDAIKKAYRKLAKQYHPDRNSASKSAERKFKEINNAYDVLSDSQKRTAYDRNYQNTSTHEKTDKETTRPRKESTQPIAEKDATNSQSEKSRNHLNKWVDLFCIITIAIGVVIAGLDPHLLKPLLLYVIGFGLMSLPIILAVRNRCKAPIHFLSKLIYECCREKSYSPLKTVLLKFTKNIFAGALRLPLTILEVIINATLILTLIISIVVFLSALKDAVYGEFDSILPIIASSISMYLVYYVKFRKLLAPKERRFLKFSIVAFGSITFIILANGAVHQ